MRRTATCTFEACAANSLQMIVTEQEDGFSQVIEIAEVCLNAPPGEALDILFLFISRSGLPFDLTIRTFWPVNLDAAQDAASAFSAVIAAYPGKSCAELFTHDKSISTGD